MIGRLLQRVFHSANRHVTVDAIREILQRRQFEEAQSAIAQLHPDTPHRILVHLCLLGELAYMKRQDELAERHFKEVLSQSPDFADAHLGLSMIFADAGKLDAALDHALFARNLNATEPRILGQLGYCYMLVGGYPAAESHLRQALQRDPINTRFLNNLAISLRSRGELDQARQNWQQALAYDPTFESARDNLRQLDQDLTEIGFEAPPPSDVASLSPKAPSLSLTYGPINWVALTAQAQAGQTDAAINTAERLLPSTPCVEDVLALCKLYQIAGDWDSAFERLEQLAVDHAETAEVWRALGEAHLRSDQPTRALTDLRRAESLGISDASLYDELATTLHRLERYQEASAEARRACALNNSTRSRKLLASTLVMCCEYEEAAAIYQGLEEEDVRFPVANRAVCLGYLGQFDEALARLNGADAEQLQDPSIRMLRGQFHLIQGHWAKGWDDYAWRAHSQTRNFRTLPFERWRGEPLQGKSLVVLAEQGLGDQIMFASCLPDILAQSPRHVVLEANQRIAPTLARSFTSMTIVASPQKSDLAWVKDLGPMDHFLHLADLPRYLRNDDDHFPRQPYLVADPQRVAYWRSRLQASGPRPWIGFSWKGGTELTRTRLRTTGIEAFQPIARETKGTWVSLQYGDVTVALADASASGFVPCHWPEAIADLDEFAALVAALDVVITVCNTTVHYAGALGKSTLVLAPRIPEWRYGVSFSHMPWYTDVEVLRQSERGEWGSVIDLAIERLSKKLSKYDNPTSRNDKIRQLTRAPQ